MKEGSFRVAIPSVNQIRDYSMACRSMVLSTLDRVSSIGSPKSKLPLKNPRSTSFTKNPTFLPCSIEPSIIDLAFRFADYQGEDTRNSFTDHLYNALVNKGFLTFRDKEGIHKGKSLKPELDKVIEQSRVSVIVFLKYYASSTWCLNELVMILDRKKTSGSGMMFCLSSTM
ncbi:hypothetical protein LguiA_008384 [Lonicera macranthoides]